MATRHRQSDPGSAGGAPAAAAEVTVSPDPSAFDPIRIDPELCIACDRCVEACQVDVFLPHPDKGKAPLVMYPGECWHSGDCVVVCPVPGAIELVRMPKNSVEWKRKGTGETFHL